MKRTTSPISVKKGAAICLISYVVLLLVFLSGGKEFVNNRIVHPLVFQIRNQTHFAIPLDPRIRIYAIDQKTMNTVDHETIPMKDWTALLGAIAKSKPRAVFIDKSFLLTLSKDEKEIQKFKVAVASLPNVIAGATFTPAQVQGLAEMDVPADFKNEAASLPLSQGFIYGPRPEIVKAFTHVGHTNYEDNGYIKPFIRTTDDQVIPFWSLFVGHPEIHNGEISIDEETVPVDSENRILVNLSSPVHYWNNTYSLINVLKKARAGEKIKDITSESIVVILTGMHAGTAAMKATPAGTMPGGFILTEVINSALSNSWIRYTGIEPFFILIFCVLGWALAVSLDSRKFWAMLMASEILLAAIGIWSFVFFSRLLPWAFPAAGLFLTGIALFVERSRISEAKAKALQFSLGGMIEPEKLEQIMKNPDQFRLEPKSQVLTVMFIDIVGFSTMAEHESPAQVFKRLRELLGLASDLVHKSGGVIDRSLGDGLLCFFGYQFNISTDYPSNHAEDAMKCAAAIQNEILRRDLLAMNSGDIIFPLRIGVNTGEVYVGDLGAGHKIDFTIIGHSVNFAQRLESACENYRVMCGPATKDFLDQNSKIKLGTTRKHIAIKHHTELVEAYEFDPYYGDPEKQQNRKLLCRKIDQSSRGDMRWPANPDSEIKISGSFGEGVVANFSRSGLEIASTIYIGKGAVINFAFLTDDNKLEQLLKAEGVMELTAEIRWSWKEADEAYRLGLMFKNQSDEIKASTFKIIRQYLNHSE